jgi:ubiquinone/menaquinone biosynthesis C-methylase UbiE/uncharacterized protein YbaR (Trm112 family)
MQPKFLEILQCPICRSSGLELQTAELRGEELWQGIILCKDCDQSYPIQAGIPCLLNREQQLCQQDDFSSKWLAGIHQVEQDILDEDIKTYKEIIRVKGGLQNISEDAERLLWEKKLHLDNDVLRHELGEDKAAKWSVDRENIQMRNSYVFKAIEESGASFAEKTILHIGPGIDGDIINRLEQMNAEIINCDLIMEPLLHLRKDKPRECYCTDMKSLPFADNTFDALFCFHVIHHIQPMSHALSEAIRVLKPNGKIFVVELNYFHLFSLLGKVIPDQAKRKIRREIRKRFQTRKRLFAPSPYEKIVKSSLILQSMREVGFAGIARRAATHAPIIFPHTVVKLWNSVGNSLPAVFDPIALEYLFIGQKNDCSK